METSPKYLTVTDLNFYLSKKFKNDPYLHKVFLQGEVLSLIHISEPTRRLRGSRMPSSA